MKEGVKDKYYNKTLSKWFVLITILPLIGIITMCIVGILTKDNIYSVYFQELVFNWIFLGGVAIWVLGAFLIECKFVFSKGIDKNSLICLLLFAVLVAVTGKSLVNGILYNGLIDYAKDFSYAQKKVYCEKVEQLNYIVKTERAAKSSSVTISLETVNDTYGLSNNIVTKSTYEEFKNKFKKGDKVKIKYLPNTKFVLSVEKLDE